MVAKYRAKYQAKKRFMKRRIGVLFAIAMALYLIMACDNGGKTTTTTVESMMQNQGASVESDDVLGGAAGTNGEQITSEAVATPLSKRGYLSENWMELFGVEKLAMSRVYICPSRRTISRYCQFLRMMAIGNRYYANSAEGIFTSAHGGVIVPVGTGCDNLAIRFREELLGWIKTKAVPQDDASDVEGAEGGSEEPWSFRWELDFSTTQQNEFMDVTEFVTPNPHLRDVVKSLMRLYLPGWKRL